MTECFKSSINLSKCKNHLPTHGIMNIKNKNIFKKKSATAAGFKKGIFALNK